ncbi:MAG: hypothetical protein NTZ11_04935 [Gammaproteobacteria bacterium]|nr:hypothetical protein [Gammaproteobacteria bacterium]
MKSLLLAFTAALSSSCAHAAPVAPADSHETVRQWIVKELSGDEAARVGIFKGCETIDSACYCGSSPAHENVLVVADDSVRQAWSGDKVSIEYRVLAQFQMPAGDNQARALLPVGKQSTFSIKVVGVRGRPQLVGTPPRAVALCSAKALLSESLAQAESLDAVKTPWALALRRKAAQELELLATVEGFAKCP